MGEQKKYKLEYIDALRGFAILGVLMVHSLKCGSKDLYFPEAIKYSIGNGARGVQLFFIVSAFTLFLSFSHRDGKESSPTLFFFIRRFFRIAPLYYVGIAYYLWQDGFGARYWIGDETSLGTMHVLSNVLFIHSINPYWINSVVPGGWSIGVEMLFYCMVPYLFEKIKNSSQALNFIVICLFLRAALEAFLKLSPTIRANRLYNEFFFLSLPSQLPVFGAGILLFFIIKEGYSISSTGRSVAIIACMILLNYVSGNNIFLPTYLMFGFGFLLLALALSKTPFPILVNPLFTFMGKISYSMYLSHFALLYWMEKNGLGDFINVTGVTSALANYCIRLLVLLLATMSVSWLMYKLIELPAQKMARRIIRKISQQNQSQLVIHSNEI